MPTFEDIVARIREDEAQEQAEREQGKVRLSRLKEELWERYGAELADPLAFLTGPEDCPEQASVEDFARGTLPFWSGAYWKTLLHARQCETCRETLREMRGNRTATRGAMAFAAVAAGLACFMIGTSVGRPGAEGGSIAASGVTRGTSITSPSPAATTTDTPPPLSREETIRWLLVPGSAREVEQTVGMLETYFETERTPDAALHLKLLSLYDRQLAGSDLSPEERDALRQKAAKERELVRRLVFPVIEGRAAAEGEGGFRENNARKGTAP